MWMLDNRTPYGAERNWTRDAQGAHWWIVAVKATFSLAADGQLELADEQPPPELAPEYFGEPGKSSLRYDSDLLAVKPDTDVLVAGHAHAPGGRAAPTVPVGIRVGKLQKQLLVHGDRVYRMGPAGLNTSGARPFRTRPIRYELAFGGTDFSDPDPKQHRIDERNPVGRGFAVRTERLEDKPAHSIEYTSGDPAKRGPAGFGPIDPGWQPRRALAGTYDERWAKSKKPLLPDDFKPSFALSSPVDQRLAKPLVGGERVELLNLTPEGRLLFEIPRMTLGLTAAFGRRREPLEPHLVTVMVEPEDHRLSLTWQATLRVPAPHVDYLDSTEIVEREGAA
jgi:hypothetical protein